jgi:TonB family protein
MKNKIITLILLLFFTNGFSQNAFVYKGRLTPSVKKEKLNEVETIGDITSELWHKLVLPYKERDELEYQRRMGYPLGYYLYPLGGYEAVVDYDSVEISAICNGKVQTSMSPSDKLTAAQKNILNTVDPGADINIKIKFKYKHKERGNPDSGNETKEGRIVVAAVPETEAEYPGGVKQLSEYLTQNVINRYSEPSDSRKLQNVIVKFRVNEKGQIVDAKIVRMSTDLQMDLFVLNAINKMPKWTPAKNSKGVNVKQEFTIPFGGEGC